MHVATATTTSRSTCGSRSIPHILRAAGIVVGSYRARSLMRHASLRPVLRR
ncbi:IS3 family transposase [Achromobacter denitrificans]